MPFQLRMMSADGFCFHLTTLSGFRNQTPDGSDAGHQKCSHHFVSIIPAESQVQLELVSPNLPGAMTLAKFVLRFTLNPQRGQDTSLSKHHIKARNRHVNSELKQLGAILTRVSFLSLGPVRPLRWRRLSNSQPFHHHQRSSVSRQSSTFSARLLQIKMKPLSSTAAFIVPFVE